MKLAGEILKTLSKKATNYVGLGARRSSVRDLPPPVHPHIRDLPSFHGQFAPRYRRDDGNLRSLHPCLDH